MVNLTIGAPVGDIRPNGLPCPNLQADVEKVQYLLNRAPAAARPLPLLKVDGQDIASLIPAICTYEQYCGHEVDGWISPGDPTWLKLAATDLPEFDGLTDGQEIRSIMIRPLPQWNFTRSDYRHVAAAGGLRFAPECDWCPPALKARYLALFDELLDPGYMPTATFGVSPTDWYHSHLGLWSGIEYQPISFAANAWLFAANGIPASQTPGLLHEIVKARAPFLTGGYLVGNDIAAYRLKLLDVINSPEMRALFMGYAGLAEGLIIHHTFEVPKFGIDMAPEDARRNKCVNIAGMIGTPPYLPMNEFSAASARGEYIMEGAPQINFAIDKTGLIYMTPGGIDEIATLIGVGSEEYREATQK